MRKPVIWILCFVAMLKSASGRQPKFEIKPNSTYFVAKGDDLNLPCVARGPPKPTVTWRKGLENLTSELAIPRRKDVLLLRNITETAVYTCTATSSEGIKEVNSTVIVQSDRPTQNSSWSSKQKFDPRNLKAQPLNSTQMVISWEEPEGFNGPITEYKLYYTTNPTLPFREWNKKPVERNEMTTIYNLIPQSTYTIRIRAYTATGNPISPPIQATTPQAAPSSPWNFQLPQAPLSSAKLQWKNPLSVNKSPQRARQPITPTPPSVQASPYESTPQQLQNVYAEAVQELTSTLKPKRKNPRIPPGEELNPKGGGDPCLEPEEGGMCRAYFERFYFNKAEGKCQMFIFGGCGGNGNNFQELKDCETACARHLLTP